MGDMPDAQLAARTRARDSNGGGCSAHPDGKRNGRGDAPAAKLDRPIGTDPRGPVPVVVERPAYALTTYSMILETTPAPTVRPPSRIAKRRPSSMAIGAISCTSIATLSPGITISVPSGSVTTPVTSVVRK